MAQRGSINPAYYNRPNHISIFASEIAYPIVDKIIGIRSSQAGFGLNRLPFYLASRLLTAGWGTLLTATAFLIGDLVALPVGIIAAGLFTFFPPYVVNSHFITPDISLTALLMLMVFSCIKFITWHRTRDLFHGIVFTVLAIAEKYPALLAVFVLIAVVAFGSEPAAEGLSLRFELKSTGKRAALLAAMILGLLFLAGGFYGLARPDLTGRLRDFLSSSLNRSIPGNFELRIHSLSRLALFFGISTAAAGILLVSLPERIFKRISRVLLSLAAVLFLVSPYLFVKFSGVFSGLAVESSARHVGADGLGFFGNAVFYAKDFLSHSGFVLLFFAAAGCAFVVARQRAFMPLLFGLFYWLCISLLSLHWSRWGLPIYACMLLLAALGVHASASFLKARIGAGRSGILFAGACVIPAVSLVLSGLAVAVQFTLKDTRVVALEWSRSHGVTELNSRYEGYTPFLPNIQRELDLDQPSAAVHVIISSDMYERYFQQQTRYPAEVARYRQIFRLKLLKSFEAVRMSQPTLNQIENILTDIRFLKHALEAHDGRYQGPTISIFRAATRAWKSGYEAAG